MQAVCDSVAAHFGDSCEVVFHDLTMDYSHTIVAIANGHITGRAVGGCGTVAGLQALRENDLSLKHTNDCAAYLNRSPNGAMLKTTSAYFRDTSGEIIASLCINQDISNLLFLQEEVSKLLSVQKDTSETFSNDISDILDSMINDAIASTGKPVERMTRKDKIAIIQHLDKQGAFLVKRSVERICMRLSISRNSFYAYLDDGRG